MKLCSQQMFRGLMLQHISHMFTRGSFVRVRFPPTWPLMSAGLRIWTGLHWALQRPVCRAELPKSILCVVPDARRGVVGFKSAFLLARVSCAPLAAPWQQKISPSGIPQRIRPPSMLGSPKNPAAECPWSAPQRISQRNPRSVVPNPRESPQCAG